MSFGPDYLRTLADDMEKDDILVVILTVENNTDATLLTNGTEAQADDIMAQVLLRSEERLSVH